jgi:transcriptional regulator with XRE-family HTH domain
LAARIARILQEMHWRPSDLAREIGAKQQVVYNWLHQGRKGIHRRYAFILQDKYHWSARWILEGVGPARHTLGSRIRARREAIGLSQGELAERIGVTASAVSQWELDATNVLGKHLVKVAATLDTSVNDLTGDASVTSEIDTARLAKAIELLNLLPEHGRGELSSEAQAKLLAYLYSSDLEQVRPGDVRRLLVLL